MGGRGSAYQKLVKELEKMKQEQHENYDGEPVKLEDFLKDPESEIHDEMFERLKTVGFSTRESTDTVNKYALTVNQKWIEILAEEFDFVFDEMKMDIQFGVENLPSDTGGLTAPYHNEKGELMLRVVLNEDDLNNLEFSNYKISNSVKNKWFSPINIKEDASRYAITHEMGHVLEQCIFEKLLRQNPNNSMYYDTRKVATKIRSDVEEIYKKNYAKPGEPVIMNISDYSKQNSKEWFAETFSNLCLAEKEPLPVAKALNDYIRRFE